MMNCERVLLLENLRELLVLIRQADDDLLDNYGAINNIARIGCAALPEAIREIEKNAA